LSPAFIPLLSKGSSAIFLTLSYWKYALVGDPIAFFAGGKSIGDCLKPILMFMFNYYIITLYY